MRSFLIVFLFIIFDLEAYSQNQKVLLPNGWSLSPAGTSVQVGDLPLNMAVTKDGKLAAITNNGLSSQSIMLVDTKTGQVTSSVEIPKSWLGLAFSDDGKTLYASGGNDNMIRVYQVSGKTLAEKDSIVLGQKWPNPISAAGITLDEKTHVLYVATKELNALLRIDLTAKNDSGKRFPLGAEGYTCVLSQDAKKLYVSVWGAGQVKIFDTKTQKFTDSISVGSNPNDMCLTKNGKYLFVANSVDNTVSVIDLVKNKVIETLNCALYPNAPDGSTTNSVALSKDQKTLYIANADNNCLAVFDVSTPGRSKSKGFIPTGWYPTCVRTVGDKLFVLNGKGNNSLPNPKGPQPCDKNGQSLYKTGNKKNSQYIGGLFTGTLSMIPVPDAKALAAYSKTVYENTPYTKEKETLAQGEAGNPIPRKIGDTTPIKHVFYIMKENRTYDQVLGDEPKGNGDTSLVLFGKNITPNQHALAEQFVLLDNFYVDAEVSADGHNWSMAAYANDYVEKTWPTNYSGRGGNYDYAANKKVATPRDGFLWDFAIRKGLTFRDYGEFTDDDGTCYLPDLAKHMCPGYAGWNLDVRDIDREKVWEKDFDSLMAANAVPQLNIVYFPSDHTAGLSRKYRTPFAYVADNDLAVGTLIEHLSHSPLWKDCAVFILEDDAQNGPDHVDAHRSPAYLVSPYVKRNFTDHHMYSTSSMLRTIELALGLPPMSQYDAAALPMFNCFTPAPDSKPFTKIEETVNMNEMNTAMNHFSTISESFDLSSPDKVPDDVLSMALWYGIKHNTLLPAPRHAAFVNVNGEDKDDD